jgi:hypothetical protein
MLRVGHLIKSAPHQNPETFLVVTHRTILLSNVDWHICEQVVRPLATAQAKKNLRSKFKTCLAILEGKKLVTNSMKA